MDIAEVSAEMARMDALLAPIANSPVDSSDPDWVAKMMASEPMDETGTRASAQRVLWAIVAMYADGDDGVRDSIRELFNRYTSFRWAAHLSREWSTAADFRVRLIVMSAHDQGPDTRDEVLTLHAWCARAWDAGIDVEPILIEVADMSSEVDRYGMGSTREMIRRFS